jgi:hypothetical protein
MRLRIGRIDRIAYDEGAKGDAYNGDGSNGDVTKGNGDESAFE